jgi:AAA-like domain
MLLSIPPMAQKSQAAKRKRGILLSKKGWQRLQAAEMRYVNLHNDSKLLTLQDLSDRTGLSANTLARVRGRKIAVDQQTLECYFRAFDLSLNPEDYTDSEGAVGGRMILPPSGQLALDSPFYVSRTPVEAIFQDAILHQSGGLVRLKAPRQSGKSSLASKVLLDVRSQSVGTVMINLRLVDAEVMQDLGRFLKWFCAVVTRSLGLENKLDDHWDALFGVSYNCTYYFENYILPQMKMPLVVVLDDVDVVFNHEHIAADFFGMLRTWHEKGRYGDRHSELWQQLRLALVYATDVYAPMNMTQSPFNAGVLIDLPGFGLSQVQELAKRYSLPDADQIAEEMSKLVGGNPFLIHWGLYQLSLPEVTIDQLFESAISPNGIYSSHLRQKLADLRQNPESAMVMKAIVNNKKLDYIEPLMAFQLQSQGLVVVENQQLIPSCDLYRRFFLQALQP